MISARSAADRIVLDMLATALEASGRPVSTLTTGGSLDELVERAIGARPELTCVVAVSATRGSEARSICRRIRAARPHAKLLALRPLPDSTDAASSMARMKEAGADRVAINLHQAMEEVQELLGPVASADGPATRAERQTEAVETA
jgi:hypothetical protein